MSDPGDDLWSNDGPRDPEEFVEGKWAYVAGERSDANPYKRGTFEYRQWRAGWTDMALLDAAATDAGS